MTDSSVGSAFGVKHESNSTLLATNAHVMQGNSVVTLKWSDESKDQAAVVKVGEVQSLDNDLALLEVSGNIGEVLKVKQEKLQRSKVQEKANGFDCSSDLYYTRASIQSILNR